MQFKIFTALAVLLFLANTPVLPAVAQKLEPRAAEMTSAGQIAMIFYRLTEQTPDFEGWAAKAESYINAPPFDKITILQQKTTELKNIFNLISLQEPIVVSMPVRLSLYSQTNHGFFIENFRDDTYFGYSFMGQNYALVPQALMDHQWISIGGTAATLLEKIAASKKNRSLMLYFEITPRFADKTAPLNLDGEDYWLVSGEISNLRIYDPTYGRLVWESNSGTGPAPDIQELLNLKQ